MLLFLLYIWQLPQNLVGLFWLLVNHTKKFVWEKTDCNFYEIPDGGAVSLGNYIFVGWQYNETIKHEYGHHRQSTYLGPLYLLLIGLPSICGYWIDVLFHSDWGWEKREKWYYNLPWEKWADKLGGVKRYYPNM